MIGERFDADAGLQYLNARYYDPKLAMFIQPDWWEVMQPGVGVNRYGYSGNDPVNGMDPGGHAWYNNWNDFKSLFSNNSPIEAGLRQVADHRAEIHASATKYGVDPKGVASIVFQENYWGSMKEIKNKARYSFSTLGGGKVKGSYGIAEIQISRAIKVSGMDPMSPYAAQKAYELLQNPATSIDLAAKGVSMDEGIIGRKLFGSDAAMAHNMGAERYMDYINPNYTEAKPSDRVALRSSNYQEAIARALDGYITLKPDGWQQVYGKLDYHGLEYSYDQ